MWFAASRRARVLVGAFVVVGVGAIATIVQGASLSFAARTAGFAGVSKTGAGDTPLAAWTELGPDGLQVARAVMASGSATCPQLVWEGGGRPMKVRARTTADGAFTDTVCEAPLPVGVTGGNVAGVPVPSRKATIEKVALLGDTGCKFKEQENCDPPPTPPLPTSWVFAGIADKIKAESPDLIIHLGDIFYRTSAACPKTPKTGCSEGIDEDFFQPVAPMLAVAPLVMARGNHEEYGADCVGWFRYFEPTLNSAVPCTNDAGITDCTNSPSQRFTLPYDVMLNPKRELIVLDTSAAPNPPKGESDEYAKEYKKELACAEKAVPSQPAWLVSHVPFWYVAKKGAEGGPGVLEHALKKLGGGLPPNIQMVISGHLHQFEYLSFTTKVKEPPQLILGDGGTKMSTPQDINPGDKVDDYNNVILERGLAEAQFGYGVIHLENGGESIKVKLLDGKTDTCTLQPDDLSCST
jgi:Calcineurin-like phosphoesterase